MNSWLGLLISFLYIFGVIGLAQLLRSWRGLGREFTRKFIHISVGMFIWIVPFLFDAVWPFVFACLAFVAINIIDWHYGLFSSMTGSDRSNLGTVYFPIAAAAAALVLWDTAPLMVAALMPLTWGDGLAAVIGRAYGHHYYSFFGQERSIEGSLAFLAAAGPFTWLALWLMTGIPELTPHASVLPAVVVVAATAGTEAVSIRGLDNLTITAVAVLILSFWPF